MSSIAGATGLPPIPSYLQDIKNEPAAAARYGQTNAQSKADIAYLQKVAPTLNTVDALMKNYRALGIVLGAFGMSDQIAYPALVRQLITQDPTSAKSLAQEMGNASYLNFAKAMGQYKTNPFSDAANMSAVTNAYTLSTYETAQGNSVPGMTQALSFKRQASQITSVARLMTNPSALKVAVNQIGLDYTTFGLLSYDRQLSLLTTKVKLADFQDPKKVEQMAERYLIAASQDPTSCGAVAPTANTVASLLGGGGSSSILSLFT